MNKIVRRKEGEQERNVTWEVKSRKMTKIKKWKTKVETWTRSKKSEGRNDWNNKVEDRREYEVEGVKYRDNKNENFNNKEQKWTRNEKSEWINDWNKEEEGRRAYEMKGKKHKCNKNEKWRVKVDEK